MSKKDKIILNELNIWLEQNLINQETYENLSSRYSGKAWDISTIIRWALSLGAIMLGIGIISFISLILLSLILSILFLSTLCGLGYYYGFSLTSKQYKHYYPKTGNSILAASSLILCADIFAIGEFLSSGTEHWPILLLITSILYFLLAYWKRNTLILIFGLIGIATWFGTESGYISGWGAYFLGLNYPIRFAIVSPIVVLIGFLHKKLESDVPESFIKSYYAVGLLYINLSLWIMSIFGNYGNLYEWRRAGHFELLIFVIIWGIVDLMTFIIGTKYNNKMFVGYSIVFIITNLYTRYFEYFWNGMHKSLFFIILGGMSISIGLYFERRLKIKAYSKSIDQIKG